LVNGERPKVRIAGEAVEVLEARANGIWEAGSTPP
jgi:hypothetical protein